MIRFGISFATVLRPTVIGVPTAPNDTGTLSETKAITAATNGLIPIATINGPVIVAGVPNPLAPSIKPPNKKAIKITNTLLSVDTAKNPLFILLIAFVFFKVLTKVIAPNKIYIIVIALCTPIPTDANITFRSIFQTSNPNTIIRIMLKLIPTFALFLSITKNTNGPRIGIKLTIIFITSILTPQIYFKL